MVFELVRDRLDEEHGPEDAVKEEECSLYHHEYWPFALLSKAENYDRGTNCHQKCQREDSEDCD